MSTTWLWLEPPTSVYDVDHAVITTTELVHLTCGSGCSQESTRLTAPTTARSLTLCTNTLTWQASVTQYDPFGQHIATIDGRGVDVPNTLDKMATVAALNSMRCGLWASRRDLSSARYSDGDTRAS